MTWHSVLGVSCTATEAQVNKAYHQRAREVHPDRNPGRTVWATAEMQKLNEAHEQALRAVRNGPRVDPFAAFTGSTTRRYHVRKVATIIATVSITVVDLCRREPVAVRFRRENKGEMVFDSLEVIPGADAGDQIFRARGHVMGDRPRGDVRVTFVVNDTAQFRLINGRVVTSIAVDLGRVILGEPFEIPCPVGEPLTVTHTLAPGDPIGLVKKLIPGKGLPCSDGSTDPLEVRIAFTMPYIHPKDAPLIAHALKRKRPPDPTTSSKRQKKLPP